MLFETITVHILHIFLEFVQNFDFCNFSIANLLKFLAQLFQQIWNQRKILRFLDTNMLKMLEFFWGHWIQIEYVLKSLKMQIRKKRLNQLKNIC